MPSLKMIGQSKLPKLGGGRICLNKEKKWKKRKKKKTFFFDFSNGHFITFLHPFDIGICTRK